MPLHHAREIPHHRPRHRTDTGVEVQPHAAVADDEGRPFGEVRPGATGGEVGEDGGVEVGEEGAGGGVGEEGGEGVEVLVPVGAKGGVGD